MNLKLRIALLAGFTALGFLLSLLGLRAIERREAEQMVADERQNRVQLLNHWIDFTGRALPQFTADYVHSDALAFAAKDPSSTKARNAAAKDLIAAGFQSLWLLRPDCTVQLQVQARGADTISPPLAAAEISALVAETPSPHFFAEADGELMEISLRRLPQTAAGGAGWLMIARRWDDTWLRALGDLTDSAISLVPLSERTAPAESGNKIVLLRPLTDWRGHPLQMLRLDYQAPELSRLLQTDSRQSHVFVVFGVLLVVAFGLALQAWVLRPLKHIGESLASGDPAPMRKLRDEPSELGRVARLVESSFEQHDELRREIEERARAQEALQRTEAALRRTLDERARLGRDLHDGVIQSLYAAGMGLAGVRTLLHPDQAEVAARLEQTRGALNETIHDVRNFISGLEPEALKLQSFTQAVTALLEVVHGLRPLRTTVEVDEQLASLLTLAQRVHALQITREAVSNALRHGDATQVTVTLRPAGDNVMFEVADNGRGFDPTTLAHGGLGLGNFVERARELGAELSVDSAPGRGARVKLVFALYKTL